MNAYSYESSTPIKSILGFELLEESIVTEETLEGVFEITSEQEFNNCILIYAAKDDYMFVIHEGTYSKFQCKL